MFNKLRKYIVSIPVVSAIALAASAALADLPPGNAVTLDDVSGIVGILMRFLIVTSMVVAVICIVGSGILIMTSRDNPAQFKTGITWLKNAAIGAGVVLASGVIINTVASLVDRTFFCQISLLGICLY